MEDIVLFALLVTQAGIQISTAQFPSICMKSDPLRAKECCPDFNGSKCGSDDERGVCGIRNITIPRDKSLSVRDAWPYYFDRVCICNHNFSGYDCGRCKYGHYGMNCNSSKVVEWRPISEYSQKQWEDYVKILALTKKYQFNYLVFLTEPSQLPLSYPQTSPITLYDLFVWLHHYPAKDGDNPNDTLKKDYAHESTGFPTWHSQFLLWFEWEIQYMLKSMGREDYHMFRIPYWDWRKEKQTEDNSPFKSNRLGETVDNNGLPQVHGDLYSKFLSSWDTICWQYPKTYQICNPQNSTGQLRRCPLRENSCSNKNKLWPSDEAVKNALSLTVYDTSPFNKMASNYSFRSRLEGFLPLSDDKLQACLDNKLCLCDANNSSCIQRLLHNSIHIILGISYFGSAADNNHSKSGVMGDVAASSNDPIFLNHHAMVDCIFETWLQKNPDAQYPISSEIPKEHRYNDYIVPFLPLYKHSDMFSTTDKFGYQCTIKPIVPGKSKELRTVIAEVLGPIGAIGVVFICVVIIGVVLGCCVKKYRHKSRNNPTYTHMPSQTEHGTTNEETVPLHIRRSHDK